MSAAQTSTARTAKHTQGPWHVPGPPMAPDNFVVTTKDGDSICDCSPAGPWVSIEEAEANARMCAAAPDLVKALEEIARIGAVPDQDVEHRRIKRDQMWSIAVAAVAAAKTGGA